MKKYLIGTILMLSAIISVSCDANVETFDPHTGTGTIGPGGNVINSYMDYERDVRISYMDLEGEGDGEGTIVFIENDNGVTLIEIDGEIVLL